MKKTLKRIAMAVAAAAVLTAVPFMSGCESSHPEAVITISYDGTEYELNYKLYRNMYPQTVRHFIELAESGFYNNTIIHNYSGSSYMYGGGYSYSDTYETDYDEGELGMLDYFEINSKEAEYYNLAINTDTLTPSVYRDYIDGNYIGVYDRVKKQIELFENDSSHGSKILKSTTGSLDDPEIINAIGEDLYHKLCDDIELLDMAGDEFDMAKVNSGELTPMFFGSAMTNFFLELSPMPQPRILQNGDLLSPDNELFSAFVFKIQANMNPAHRDRIAFMRICSGVFKKGMTVYHMQGGKPVKLAQPQQFLAQERTIVEEAYPGDIIGIFDPGIFGIGDSLSDEKLKIQFEDFPVFPPEIFARVQPKDSLKRKQFEKGIVQLAQEGAIQVFRQKDLGIESFIVGVVGSLQLEVLEYRLLNEYSAQLLMNQLGYSVARWVYAENEKDIENLKGLDNGMLVYDKKDRPVILVNNEWALNWILDRNPNLQFLTVPSDVAKI